MRECPYLSKYFMEHVWPRFSATFKSPKTKNYYYVEICNFATFIKKDILSASVEDAQAYIDMLQARVSSCELMKSTLQKKYKALSSFYSYINNHRYYFVQVKEFVHPFLPIIIDMQEEVIHEQSVLKVSEYEKLTKYLYNNDLMCLCAVIFAHESLLRLQEILALKVSDIVIDANKEASVQLIKKKKIRYNKIPDASMEFVMEYINAHPDITHLFASPTKKGECYTSRALQLRLKKACKSSGIKDYTFNDLRNTGITYALSAGAPLDTVTESLGYQSTGHITRLTTAVVNMNKSCDYIEAFSK